MIFVTHFNLITNLFFEFKLHGQFFRMQNDVALTVKFEIKKRLVLGMKQKILNNFKTTSQHLTQDSVSGDLSSMTNMYLPTYTEYQSFLATLIIQVYCTGMAEGLKIWGGGK